MFTVMLSSCTSLYIFVAMSHLTYVHLSDYIVRNSIVHM